MTKKHAEYQKEANALQLDLWQNRAHRVCEVRAKGCMHNWLLALHHIVRSSKGGKNVASNVLLACPVCHSHSNFHTGVKGRDGKAMPIEEQLQLAEKLNKEHRIEQ